MLYWIARYGNCTLCVTIDRNRIVTKSIVQQHNMQTKTFDKFPNIKVFEQIKLILHGFDPAMIKHSRQVLLTVPHLLDSVQVEGTFPDDGQTTCSWILDRYRGVGNYTEAVALIATQILEFVHDGHKSVAELMDIGRQLLGRRQVLLNCPHTLDLPVQVEGTFPDEKAMSCRDGVTYSKEPSTCRYFTGLEKAVLSSKLSELEVTMGKDMRLQLERPALLSSENGNLELALHDSFLPIPSLEQRDAKSVTLVRIGGNQFIRGGNAIADNFVNDANVKTVMEYVHARGLGNSTDTSTSHGIIVDGSPLAYRITREVYANIYGPIVGDKIHLGDTDLFAEVEKYFTVYGDECVFGGGKVIRDGMGQASGYSASDFLDTVITNALIIDYTGIFKADIAGEGKIVTAGTIDCHVHFICHQLTYKALASGARGGHAPDIIKVCGVKNVLSSSTNPTHHYTKNTIDEILDMLLLPSHGSETIPAEDILHDMGAISIISSDSQAMGRIGENLANSSQDEVTKRFNCWANILDNGKPCINAFIAKYTINPAIANGISNHVGSVKEKGGGFHLHKTIENLENAFS
ncbi:urease isoform X1 [Tanacetum coccineum]